VEACVTDHTSPDRTTTPGEAAEQRSGGMHAAIHTDLTELTLAQLTDRASRGDHAAFAAIHRRLNPGVHRLLMERSAGQHQLVDDLCQSVWAGVWRSLGSGYDPSKSAISTYVYAAAHNAWVSAVRRAATASIALDRLSASQAAKHVDLDQAHQDARTLAHAELIEVVRECLRDLQVAGLTELERGIVRAIGSGAGDRDLARRLGLSPSTINKHKHSGYAKIRACLRARGLSEEAFEAGPIRDVSGAGAPASPAAPVGDRSLAKQRSSQVFPGPIDTGPTIAGDRA
jgi:RNA polymerase sigma factor (sigma-70 family)